MRLPPTEPVHKTLSLDPSCQQEWRNGCTVQEAGTEWSWGAPGVAPRARSWPLLLPGSASWPGSSGPQSPILARWRHLLWEEWAQLTPLRGLRIWGEPASHLTDLSLCFRLQDVNFNMRSSPTTPRHSQVLWTANSFFLLTFQVPPSCSGPATGALEPWPYFSSLAGPPLAGLLPPAWGLLSWGCPVATVL